MKNPELDQSQEYCLNLLRKSLQYSVNEKINKILNEYKKDYINPMIEKFRKNYGHEASDEDACYMCIQLLDEVRQRHVSKFSFLLTFKF